MLITITRGPLATVLDVLDRLEAAQSDDEVVQVILIERSSGRQKLWERADAGSWRSRRLSL